MSIKLSLIAISTLFILNGCSNKNVNQEIQKEVFFTIVSTNKNLKPINYDLNITNIGSGECMDFNRSDLGVLNKRDGLIIDTTNNKEDIKDSFVKVKQGDSLEINACNIDNRMYKFNIKQNITNPIVNGKLKFNGKEYDRLNDIQINNEATIEINETIDYMDLFKMSVKQR